MGKTAIEWAEETWNPVTGCDATSPGCDNCYAERLAGRLQRMGSPRYVNGFNVTIHHDLIDRPRSWRKPRSVFVCSMADLFHPDVDDDTINYEFTIEDPLVWSEPIRGELPFERLDGLLYEYACHEGNYAMENVLRGARAEEARQNQNERRER